MNDAMQVAAIIGVNGNATCDTGAAVLLEDHGTTSLLLCAGQTVGADTITRPDTTLLRTSSGFLGDDGVVAVPAFVNGFDVAIVRASPQGAEVLFKDGDIDDQGNSVAFGTQDVMSLADNGGVGFTSNNQHVYWAPVGGAPLLCESDANAGVFDVVATDTALFYIVDNAVKRCHQIAGENVVDTLFPGGAGLPGGPITVDAYTMWPAGGGRSAAGLRGISFDEGDAFWVIDTTNEPPTARLTAPASIDDPVPKVKAISPDGTHVVVEQNIQGFGQPASYEENGSLFYTTDVPAPGGTRFIVESALWAAVGNDGTVWFQAATALSLTDIGFEQTLYRALPGEPLQRMVGPGDAVTTRAGDLTVDLLQLGNFDAGQEAEHAASIANGPGAAVAILAFDGTNHAVLLLGEPQIPDLVPFVEARVADVIESTLPVGPAFDLELGVENRGIGTSRADLVVTFTPSISFTGAPPTGCTLLQDGVSTISAMDCEATAFGDLDTQGRGSVTLSNVSVPGPLEVPADLVVRMEVFQISGTPEENTANSVADVAYPFTADANLNVAIEYTVDEDEHLYGILSVLNEGPSDAFDIEVVLPGVPGAEVQPAECARVAGLQKCAWSTIAAGTGEQRTLDFGVITSNDVFAPFLPEVTSSTPDPGGPVVTVSGDPEELLKTDVAVTATATSDSDQITLRVTLRNISGITARDVVFTEVDLVVNGAVGSAGVSCVADLSDAECQPFDLVPGARAEVTLGVIGFSPPSLVRAVVTGNEDLDPANNEVAVGALLEGVNVPEPGEPQPARRADPAGCASVGRTGHLSPMALLVAGLVVLARKRRRASRPTRLFVDGTAG